MSDHILYILQLADNALIYGHRLGEWCGHGPILEQDIALTNISLDYIGQARSLYQHAANLFNELPENEKEGLFKSVQLEEKIKRNEPFDEDDLAYLRDGWDYRNILLVEQPNGDWAVTVARAFFFDVFQFMYYKALQKSKDLQLAAIAEKSLKEVTYHKRWSAEWVIRLGDGTDESHEKIQAAANDLWTFTGEMFTMTAAEQIMADKGIAVDVKQLLAGWIEEVKAVFEEATLSLPENSWMQEGGKSGRHTEHLGYILTELQFMQRTYPGMEW
ncbi:MAG: phenylacetate-CoA oxygenase subunit PaaC [Chitinophagaceae bacterium]|nr:phenylacetate-CoA oxygenase subunit PaaC [Chitinophagaceae bacterium]